MATRFSPQDIVTLSDAGVIPPLVTDKYSIGMAKGIIWGIADAERSKREVELALFLIFVLIAFVQPFLKSDIQWGVFFASVVTIALGGARYANRLDLVKEKKRNAEAFQTQPHNLGCDYGRLLDAINLSPAVFGSTNLGELVVCAETRLRSLASDLEVAEDQRAQHPQDSAVVLSAQVARTALNDAFDLFVRFKLIDVAGGYKRFFSPPQVHLAPATA